MAKQVLMFMRKVKTTLKTQKNYGEGIKKKKNWNYLINIAFTAVDLPFVNFNVMVVGII